MRSEGLNPNVTPLQDAISTVRSQTDSFPRSSQPPSPVTSDTINLSFPVAFEEDISSLISNLLDSLGRLKTLTPGSSDSQTVVLNLKEVLKGLSYKGDEDPVSYLKNFITRSGLLYEAKIAKEDLTSVDNDIKGLLMKLLGKVDKGSEEGKAVSAFLKSIETQQLVNVKGRDEGVFYLQIPLALPQGAAYAEVFVKQDKEGRGGYKRNVYRVLFSIETGDMGRVAVDTLVSGRNVNVNIQAENKEFLDFMKPLLPELAKRLAGYGMKADFNR